MSETASGASGGTGDQTGAPSAAENSDFVRAEGPLYYHLLTALHRALEPKTYLEIGSQSGASLALAKCDLVAVDPAFHLRKFVTFSGGAAHLFQMPSDEFFAAGLLGKLGLEPDFSFLDGMHLFEFLLRDFMNAEKASATGGVIALHDCCPFTTLMADRTWVRRLTRQWTGDVWKVLVILQDLRPDLEIAVFDAAPTGLVVIGGLDPESRVLPDAYEDCLAKYMDVDLETFGIRRFFDRFDYASTAKYVDEFGPPRPSEP